jgi:hypothetical protein
MAEEIAQAKKEKFPKEAKTPTKKTRPGSVGGLGDALKDRDPETLKFVGKHEVEVVDYAPSGAHEPKTKHSLDDPRNARMKPKEGVYEAHKCTKQPCDECGPKKLLLGGKKLREETLANRIAMEVLEARKNGLTELSNQMLYHYVDKAMTSKKKAEKGTLWRDKDPETATKRRKGILQATKSIKDKSAIFKEGEQSDPEVIQVDELSTRKLADYIPKAARSHGEIQAKVAKKDDFGPPRSSKDLVHDNRRIQGIKQATKKIVRANEEVTEGKSEAKRDNLALGAYYAKKRTHKESLEAAEPMLEGGKKKKKPVKEESPTEPIRLGKGVPNKFQNIGSDTGQVI